MVTSIAVAASARTAGFMFPPRPPASLLILFRDQRIALPRIHNGCGRPPTRRNRYGETPRRRAISSAPRFRAYTDVTFGPDYRHTHRRLRHHRGDRRRRNGAGLSSDRRETQAPGRDQGPATV